MTRNVTKKMAAVPKSLIRARQPDAPAGQHHEERQVPPVEEPLQRGGAGEDVADLGDLRGLEGHAAQG